jgi:hypothetical protein
LNDEAGIRVADTLRPVKLDSAGDEAGVKGLASRGLGDVAAAGMVKSEAGGAAATEARAIRSNGSDRISAAGTLV